MMQNGVQSAEVRRCVEHDIDSTEHNYQVDNKYEALSQRGHPQASNAPRPFAMSSATKSNNNSKEEMNKREKNPVQQIYELFPNPNITFEARSFGFECFIQVGNLSAHGCGSSKKKAKHAASLKILKQWKFSHATEGNSSDHSLNGESKTGITKKYITEEDLADCFNHPTSERMLPNMVLEMRFSKTENEIGALQEFSIIHKLKPPRYEFLCVGVELPVHVAVVWIDEWFETGGGKTKKEAKNIAAARMLKYMKCLIN